MSTKPAKSALITGCSDGGMGSALALQLQKRGWHVFAGIRDPKKAGDLAALPNVTLLNLDVAKSEDIAAALALVSNQLEKRGLDLLVNNAGCGYIAPLLEGDERAERYLFDVNFWGLLAVTRAFLPLLSQSRGVVVNISSGGSLIHTPWLGIYNCSKAAVTMASSNLRLELAPLGVRVLCVIAGMVVSKFGEKIPAVQLADDSPYKGAEPMMNDMRDDLKKPRNTPVEEFGRLLANDIEAGKTGFTYRGALSSTGAWVKWLLPMSTLDWILKNEKIFGLHKVTTLATQPT